MAKYIRRHDAFKRFWHWTNMIAVAILAITGAVLFVPGLGSGLSQDVLKIGQLLHRIFAVVFIGVPVVLSIIKPSTFGHSFKHIFEKWDDDDKEFMKKFPGYLFNPKKHHMPKQQFVKSGQRISDGFLFLLMIVIAITGVILWMAEYVAIAPGLFRLALLGHDLTFFGIVLIMVIHVYLGGGIFQPYKRSANVMLGDGLVSESDALYHWGHWAEAELESGENVVER